MTQEQLSEDAPAARLFPQFGPELYDMLVAEVQGLTDQATGLALGQVGLEQVERPPPG